MFFGICLRPIFLCDDRVQNVLAHYNIIAYVDVTTCIWSAHNSAGPKMDIVLTEDGKKVGFLAQDVEEYKDAMLRVISMSESERLEMAEAARQRAGKFSEQRFYQDYKTVVQPIICHTTKK